MNLRFIYLYAFLFSFIANVSSAQDFTSEGMKLRLEPVTSGEGVVWGFEFLDSQNIILTNRIGTLKVFNLTTKKTQQITGVPKVLAVGQGGLMDVALHPEFSKNKLVYLSYTCGTASAATSCLGRGVLKNNTLDGFEKIFEVQKPFPSTLNIGSRLAWGKGNALFMTMGDHFDKARDNAQKLNSHIGKVLKLTDSGKPAPGNPFAATAGALPEIYSLGHRNAQGLFYDSTTDTLWEQEHGARGGDEINVIVAGKNYGWPVISYGVNYDGTKIGEGTSKPGMEQPLHYWDPSIAPSGLLIYRGTALEGWSGDVFSGALKLTHLNRLRIKDGKVVNEERLLQDNGKRIRDVKEGPDGWIYLSTDSGEIFRIVKQ
ncbi:MAG: PQQ-dependent sugar dehydrogenase [Bdellovibrionota bacterium]